MQNPERDCVAKIKGTSVCGCFAVESNRKLNTWMYWDNTWMLGEWLFSKVWFHKGGYEALSNPTPTGSRSGWGGIFTTYASFLDAILGQVAQADASPQAVYYKACSDGSHFCKCGQGSNLTIFLWHTDSGQYLLFSGTHVGQPDWAFRSKGTSCDELIPYRLATCCRVFLAAYSMSAPVMGGSSGMGTGSEKSGPYADSKRSNSSADSGVLQIWPHWTTVFQVWML